MHDFNSVENYLICRVSLLSDFTDCDNDKIKNKIIRLDNNHMTLRICCVKIDCIQKYTVKKEREIDKVRINACTFVFCKCINCREMHTTDEL